MFSSNSPSLQNTVKGLVSFPVALAMAVGSLVTGPAVQASEEAPSILKDINTTNEDGFDTRSADQLFTEMGGELYFVVGKGLWKTDGTESGTVLLREFSSNAPESLYVFQDRLFFQGHDDSHGYELWSSDGTASGTNLFADIYDGSSGSYPQEFGAVGDILYFQAKGDDTTGYELWSTDGTAGNTSIVSDIRSGTGGSSPSELFGIGSTLYFSASTSSQGRELWKSNADGTSIVSDIYYGVGGSSPEGMVALNENTFLFKARGDSDFGVWKYSGDGGGVTTEVFGHSPQNLTKFDSKIFFTADAPFGDEDTDIGVELWSTDGVTTALVKDINSGSADSSPEHLLVHNNELYFVADDGNGSQIWISDGTSSGTVQLSDFEATEGSNITGLAALGDEIFFVAETPSLWKEVWKVSALRTDAPHTASNVKDILEGDLNRGDGPYGLTSFGSKIIFVAPDVTHGYELWSTDGTELGTALVKDVNALGKESLSSLDTVTIGEVTFFVANDGIHGTELWKTDGTANGTVMVKDIWTGFDPEEAEPFSSFPKYLTAFGSDLFFSAYDGVNGRELWKSDGTTDGTLMVKNIRSSDDSGAPEFLTVFGSHLYFSANDGTNGTELWKTDGTTTEIVKDINGSGSSNPLHLASVGDSLFFQADDGTNGKELWKTDADAGAVIVQDINGSGSSDPESLTGVGSHLYFSANDGTNGTELWKTDGTTTEIVKDINGSGSSNPEKLIAVGDSLFFRADDGENGVELWISDGSDSGTQMVKDINATGSSNPDNFAVRGSELFFTATDNGSQVWKSEGTLAGTSLVHDVRPGFIDEDAPSGISIVGATVYLIGYQAATGYELWRLIDVEEAESEPSSASVSKPYDGPINLKFVGSQPCSGGAGILTGQRLDTIKLITVGAQPVEFELLANGSLSYSLVGIAPGSHQVRISVPSSNLFLTSEIQVVACDNTIIESGQGKVNVGSFNGKLVVYALGLDGARITWKVGGIWGQDFAEGDSLNRFDRLTPRTGVNLSVDIFVDGKRRLTKTVLTR